MYKDEKFDFEQEDYDSEKKLFSAEERRARFEKKLLVIFSLVSSVFWLYLGQEMLI